MRVLKTRSHGWVWAALPLLFALALGRLVASGFALESVLVVALAPIVLVVPDAALLYVILDAWLFDRLSVVVAPAVSTTVLAASLWIVSRLLRASQGRAGLSLPWNTLNVLVGAFFAWLAVSYSLAWSRLDVTIVFNYALYLMLVVASTSEQSHQQLARVGTSAVIILGGSGLLQLITSGGVPFGGLTGMVDNHVQYALYVLVGMPFAWVLRKHGSKTERALAVVALAVGGFTLLLSLARGVYVAAAVVILIALLLRTTRANRLAVGITSAVGLTSLPLGFYYISGQLGNVTPHTLNQLLSGRIPLLIAAWNMFLDSPMFGQGYGSFSRLWAAYAPSGWASASLYTMTFSTHSTYLQILAETGILGFGLYCAILWVAARNLKKAISQSEPGSMRTAMATALLLCVVAIATHGLLDNSGWHDRLLYVFLAYSVGIRPAPPQRMNGEC